MTLSEQTKLERVAADVGEMKISLAVIAEKISHAVDETVVTRIVRDALTDHAVNCRRMDSQTAIKISGVNPALVKALMLVAAAAAGALGGAQVL